MWKNGEIGSKKVLHSEDYACNLCRAEKKIQLAASQFYSHSGQEGVYVEVYMCIWC